MFFTPLRQTFSNMRIRLSELAKSKALRYNELSKKINRPYWRNKGEKSIDMRLESKGVRLDVYVQDEQGMEVGVYVNHHEYVG